MSRNSTLGSIIIIMLMIVIIFNLTGLKSKDKKINQLQAKIDSYECVIADTTGDLDRQLVNRINKVQEWCNENNRVTESAILDVLCGAVLFDDEENFLLFATSYAGVALDVIHKIRNKEFDEDISGFNIKVNVSVAVDTVYKKGSWF